MTNADKIRAMSDEELVKKLGSSICELVEKCPLYTGCEECMLQWVKKEAKEEVQSLDAP